MKPYFFFDLETRRFEPGNMAPPPVVMSWAVGEQCALVHRGEIEKTLAPVLEKAIAGELIIAGHGVGYDFACLLAHRPKLRKLIWAAYAADGIVCTRVRERLLDIADGSLRKDYDATDGTWLGKDYDLEDVLRRRCDVSIDKGNLWRTRYQELEDVPLDQWPESARVYALDDARHGPKLIRDQDERAKKLRYRIPTQFDDSRAGFSLQLHKVWGNRTDGPRVKALWDRTLARMNELREDLTGYDLMRVTNPGGQRNLFGGAPTPRKYAKKMKAIRGLVLSTYPDKENGPPRTETGEVATGKDVLDLCHHPALDALVEFNSLEKSGSTYVRKMFDGIRLPIHPNYDPVGAETDRTSCSSPNLQNQPRLPGIRECFIPRPGYVFLASDYDSQEMRTWAQSCLDLLGKSKLADLYRRDPNFDPHLMFAAEQFLKISYEDALRLKAADDAGVLDKRQRAKAANFGFPGGLGALKFMAYARGYGVRINLEESKGIRQAWMTQWEADAYFKHIELIVGRADFGLQVIPRSGFQRGGVSYTNCANGFFQTPAAHASKRADFEVLRRCYDVETSALYDSRPAWFIHDEIGLETPEEAVHEASVELREVMVEAMAITTPDVPPRASATAMRRWSKKAKPVYHQNRLVPWDEERKAA
jgi:hypothetical protein